MHKSKTTGSISVISETEKKQKESILFIYIYPLLGISAFGELNSACSIILTRNDYP